MENKYDPRLPEFLRDYLTSTEGDHAPQKLHLVCALAASATSFGRRISRKTKFFSCTALEADAVAIAEFIFIYSSKPDDCGKRQ